MRSSTRLYELREALDALQNKTHKSADDLVEATKIADEITNLGETREADTARRAQLDTLGAPPDAGGSGSFAAALKSAGYDRVSRPSVMIEVKGVTFSGIFTDAVRVDRPAPPLGADSRFLYTELPFSGAPADTTSVASYRQTGRTLPSPVSDMVRSLAATSPKPTLTTSTELLSEPLRQIAITSVGIPNIMLASAMLSSWVEADLRYAYSVALDDHVVTEIAAANPTVAPPGSHVLESILLAAEEVANQGYAPSILAADPTFLIDLRLATQPVSGDFLFSGNEIDLGLRRVSVVGLTTPLVLDPQAAGVLYVSPVTFSTHEEEHGTTNSSTARVESSGAFVVQRTGAIAEVASAS